MGIGAVFPSKTPAQWKAFAEETDRIAAAHTKWVCLTCRRETDGNRCLRCGAAGDPARIDPADYDHFVSTAPDGRARG